MSDRAKEGFSSKPNELGIYEGFGYLTFGHVQIRISNGFSENQFTYCFLSEGNHTIVFDANTNRRAFYFDNKDDRTFTEKTIALKDFSTSIEVTADNNSAYVGFQLSRDGVEKLISKRRRLDDSRIPY